MKKHNNAYYGVGKEVWKELEKVIATGKDRSKVFSDWLDLMLNAYLSFTDNTNRYGLGAVEKLKANTFDGVYEDRYMEIVKRYLDNKPQGERAIDHFANAFGLLNKMVAEHQTDVLGELFMNRITFGERGQFFTPEHITDFMSSIAGTKESEKVMDPCCGSGRMLISAHKQNPNAVLEGVDLDERCAKMCALNMILFDCEATIWWGNSLTMKFYRQWEIRPGGWIFESDVKEVPKELGQGSLPLALLV